MLLYHPHVWSALVQYPYYFHLLLLILLYSYLPGLSASLIASSQVVTLSNTNMIKVRQI